MAIKFGRETRLKKLTETGETGKAQLPDPTGSLGRKPIPEKVTGVPGWPKSTQELKDLSSHELRGRVDLLVDVLSKETQALRVKGLSDEDATTKLTQMAVELRHVNDALQNLEPNSEALKKEHKVLSSLVRVTDQTGLKEYCSERLQTVAGQIPITKANEESLNNTRNKFNELKKQYGLGGGTDDLTGEIGPVVLPDRDDRENLKAFRVTKETTDAVLNNPASTPLQLAHAGWQKLAIQTEETRVVVNNAIAGITSAKTPEELKGYVQAASEKINASMQRLREAKAYLSNISVSMLQNTILQASQLTPQSAPAQIAIAINSLETQMAVLLQCLSAVTPEKRENILNEIEKLKVILERLKGFEQQNNKVQSNKGSTSGDTGNKT